MEPQIMVTCKKSGGWIYRKDDYVVTAFSKNGLHGGNLFSIKSWKDDIGIVGYPNLKSSPIHYNTLNGSYSDNAIIDKNGWPHENGYSFAFDNLYIVNNENDKDFSINQYVVGQNIEKGDILSITKSCFDGCGKYGTVQKNSHRIKLIKERPSYDILGMHIIGETYLNTTEFGRVPSYKVEVI